MKKPIPALVKNYLKENPQRRDSIPVSGKVYDNKELENLIEASLEGWWTENRWVPRFEEQLKNFLGVKFVHACNSGSSANLLAFSALRSPALGPRRIKKGDEIITVAAAFPTTVSPIVRCSCVPVFVDVDLGTYNVNVEQLEKAVSRKSRAVFLAHTLGNPFNIAAVKNLCEKHNLWLIEDNCDALGSEYDGRYTGTFGDVSTLSFYPAHHITTAEGGAVITNSADLSKIIRSLRDWGRHCWCPTGKDNTCGKRFDWKLGDLPRGYDHKYIYSELGYNFKMSDLHAAIGVAQMDKLGDFIKKRRANFSRLYAGMEEFGEYFILPQATGNSRPSWFGFPLSIKNNKLDREDFMRHLAKNKIGARLLFGGNLLKQPCFVDDKELEYRVVGDLKKTDFIMNSTFWIGVYPAITEQMVEKVVGVFRDYLRGIK